MFSVCLLSGIWERQVSDILIATPVSAAELVFHEWHEGMVNQIVDIPRGLKVARQRFPEPMVDIARDKAVAMAMAIGARWLWFLDADIIPPKDTLLRLINHDKPIVGGLYVRRHNPPFNEMLRFSPGAPNMLRPIQDGEYVPGELVECDAIATGCMLLNTELFEKIKPRSIIIDGNQGRPRWFLWEEWNLPNGMSEDFSFCVWARKQGVPIYCDTSIQCRHLGPIKFLPGGGPGINLEFMGAQG